VQDDTYLDVGVWGTGDHMLRKVFHGMQLLRGWVVARCLVGGHMLMRAVTATVRN